MISFGLFKTAFDAQNMPRPFAPMKKLDMDKVIKDIAKKIS